MCYPAAKYWIGMRALSQTQRGDIFDGAHTLAPTKIVHGNTRMRIQQIAANDSHDSAPKWDGQVD